jgi:uncharacterized protein YeaO (DUF488 family)
LAIRIVRLGSPRAAEEGLRLGTVRRPPRGVPRAEFGSRDYYDVWYPVLAPTAELVAEALAAQHARDDKAWRVFVRKFRAEMAVADTSRTLDLLAALSHQTNFSLGCYCEEEHYCHRSILRALLAERGAKLI